MTKILKLLKEPLVRRAADAIRDAIFDGQYLPEDRLVEEELAASLGVSRNVVREAFWQLEAQGLVESDDYKGKSVAALSPEKMAEMIPLRLFMESLAAAWAARHVGEQSAAALNQQVARFSEGITDYPRYAALDFELHEMIWDLAGNRHMAILLNRIVGPMIALQVKVCQPMLGEILKREFDRTEGSHHDIVEAICSRAPGRASRAMQKHVLAFWQIWLAQNDYREAETCRWQGRVDDTIQLLAVFTTDDQNGGANHE